jgi:hypothetical protein
MMKAFKEVKDSGKHQEFATGSVRDTRDGKGRYDLISPIALKRLAQHYENGARKYNPRNWEKGQPLSRYMDSAIRHAFNIMAGMDDEDHAAGAAWNIFAFIHTQEMIRLGLLPKELDDMPKQPTTVIELKEATVTFGNLTMPASDVTLSYNLDERCEYHELDERCTLKKDHPGKHVFPKD